MLWIPILLCIQFSTLHGASSEAPPEPELLQMMELLEEWEMIHNLELMKQMESAGPIEDTSVREVGQYTAPEVPIEEGQKWNGNLR